MLALSFSAFDPYPTLSKNIVLNFRAEAVKRML
jgi:hypothetical protein